MSPPNSHAGNASSNANANHSEPHSPDRAIKRDLVCLGCGCLCDDIVARPAVGDEQVFATDDCSLGAAWFQPLPDVPQCIVDGQAAPVEAGLERAAELLRQSQAPLVYGLSRTTTPAQRAAVQLADRLGAVLDLETDAAFRTATIAKSRQGLVSATFGEIGNRSDLAIVWCGDLTSSHPRAAARLFRNAKVIEIGKRHLPDADLIELAPSQFADTLAVLLMLLSDKRSDVQAVEARTGQTIEFWQRLLDRMKSAKYGSLLFDGSLQTSHNFELLFRFVRQLNEQTRFVCLAMSGPANVNGAVQVATWSTGYPFGINFAAGYPEYSPHEFQAEKLWERNEVDLTLAVACNPLDQATPAATTHLKKSSLIAIDWQATETTRHAEVAFFVGRPGGEAGETAYRLDGVPLPVRANLDPTLPTAAWVLSRLNDRIAAEALTHRL